MEDLQGVDSSTCGVFFSKEEEVHFYESIHKFEDREEKRSRKGKDKYI